MGKHKKGNYKKTPAELQAYKNFIDHSTYNPESTIPVQNEMLQGSSEYGRCDGKEYFPGSNIDSIDCNCIGSDCPPS